LAIKTLVNTGLCLLAVPGDLARRALAGSRFADVRWVQETGSTNADALALAREGEPEGVVLVADHQTAGRGRQGRTWEAPPEASLLVSVLLRPPSEVAGLVTMAVSVAATAALDAVAGFAPGIKWPNDLVWPGDGSAPDRKLGGILAEADWPARSPAAAGWSTPPPDERVVVVAGMGLNVNWPADLPEDLGDIAVAANHIAGHPIDREVVLVAFLEQLDATYGELVERRGASTLLARWRERSATLGRRVRVDLGVDDVTGTAVDITADGHLVLATDDGDRRATRPALIRAVAAGAAPRWLRSLSRRLRRPRGHRQG
jgi:BirA family biotin operon repressor/biotin-[acetyl-CoA-carboxylase] ligase